MLMDYYNWNEKGENLIYVTVMLDTEWSYKKIEAMLRVMRSKYIIDKVYISFLLDFIQQFPQ